MKPWSRSPISPIFSTIPYHIHTNNDPSFYHTSHAADESGSANLVTKEEEAIDPLAKNSAALTTFLLLNTMIGSGILNQPYVFKNSGVLGGILGFIIASVATWISLLLLTEAGIRVNILEYSGLAKFAFQANGELAIDWSMYVYDRR